MKKLLRRERFHGKAKANRRESSVEQPINSRGNLKLLHAINEYSVEASYACYRMSIICQCFLAWCVQ